MGMTDCAAASLTAVLRYHGVAATLLEIQERLAPGRDGVSASALLHLAKTYGLHGRGVECDAEDVDQLPQASILFWHPSHFVVFDRCRGTRVEIVDPASGRRRVAAEDFKTKFKGVALLFDDAGVRATVAPRAKPRFHPATLLLRSKWLIARIVIIALLAQALGAIVPLITGILIDRVVPTGDYSLLWVLTALFVAAQGGSVFAVFIRAHLLVFLKYRLETALTLGFVRHLSRLPYRFFQEHTSGDLFARIASNDFVRDLLTSAAMAALIDGTTAVIFLLVLVWSSPRIAAIVALLGLARVALLLITGSRQRRILSELVENQARSHTCQIELLTGMETLKGMGSESQVLRGWIALFLDSLNISIRRGRLDALISAGLGTTGVVTTLALTFYGTALVLDGTLTLGMMLACAALAAGFITPLNSLIAAGVQLPTLDLYLERIADVMNTPTEATGGTGTPRLRGSVELRNVSFRYSAIGPRVVEDACLRMAPGDRVAITGPSGSGKSTIARLIAGLYEPESGAVLLDGVDLRSLDKDRIRSQLGIVTQDVQLFTGTIRSNIALTDPDLDFDDIVFAATVACIHDDITRMPLGYDTPIADRGLSLSGGQRQRLAIARAIARRPRILILDEATSHLDTLTQDRLKRNLAALACTQIIIAHRMSTIRDADQIVVIDRGRIVATGTHEALVEEAGTYAKLVGV